MDGIIAITRWHYRGDNVCDALAPTSQHHVSQSSSTYCCHGNGMVAMSTLPVSQVISIVFSLGYVCCIHTSHRNVTLTDACEMQFTSDFHGVLFACNYNCRCTTRVPTFESS